MNKSSVELPLQHEDLPPAFHDPSQNILRPAQVMANLDDILEGDAATKNDRIQDKGAARGRLRNLKLQYERQAPRHIKDGALKDKLVARSKELLDKILPGMLSKEEMRKNDAGSVDKHVKWERANKRDIKEWKKINQVLNVDSSPASMRDRDASNLERHRPNGAVDRMRSDAQIKGHMSYGNVPQENWDQVFPPPKPVTFDQSISGPEPVRKKQRGRPRKTTPTAKPIPSAVDES